MDNKASFEAIAKLSRRTFLGTAAAAGLGKLAIGQGTPVRDDIVHADLSMLPPYGNGTIPAGIRSRQIANVNGVSVHILEAGYEVTGRQAIFLLHGFPELASARLRSHPRLG